MLPMKKNETKSVISYTLLLRGSQEEGVGVESNWKGTRPSRPQLPNYQPTHGQCSMKEASAEARILCMKKQQQPNKPLENTDLELSQRCLETVRKS